MSVFDLSGVIASLANTTVIVSRLHAADSYDANGRAVARTYDDVAVGVASVQPISGNDLNKLPEGERDIEWATIYFAGVLLDGDIVTTPSTRYQVRTMNNWVNTGAYTKALLRKFDDQEPRP